MIETSEGWSFDYNPGLKSVLWKLIRSEAELSINAGRRHVWGSETEQEIDPIKKSSWLL